MLSRISIGTEPDFSVNFACFSVLRGPSLFLADPQAHASMTLLLDCVVDVFTGLVEQAGVTPNAPTSMGSTDRDIALEIGAEDALMSPSRHGCVSNGNAEFSARAACVFLAGGIPGSSGMQLRRLVRSRYQFDGDS